LSKLKTYKRIAFAESCTGGALASRITSEPGASKYFAGSIVCYQEHIKRDVLGVSAEYLQKYGAVSEQVALEMLSGVLRVMSADFGIAITGFAGPEGGTPEVPVGTVWLAWGAPAQKPHIEKLQLSGTRIQIIEQVLSRALGILS
jgi:PncC family amidohydrolase